MPIRPVCLAIAVGLSPRHLDDPTLSGVTPNLSAIRQQGGAGPLAPVLPAVTMSAQASLLTGQPPAVHGVVGNGWHYRDTDEIRFWQQSRRLIQAPLLYETARDRAVAAGEPFTAANLFGWFNQGSAVEWALTPKPWYGSDGSKVFDIHGKPLDFVQGVKRQFGDFPFHAFWGPMAGAASSEWIARVAAWMLRRMAPTFSLVYLPHLDYDLQRYGENGPHLREAIGVLDDAVGMLANACTDTGTRLVLASEYGISDVYRGVPLNRVLRDNGWLATRSGPFGELIDIPETRAVAVADHQIAHVTVRNPKLLDRVAATLAETPGVGEVLTGEARAQAGLDHPRAGDIVVLAAPDSWFSYYYWAHPRQQPDFAPTVDIHRKPGFDPLEMFFAPELRNPKFRAGRRLLQKKLGLRYRMDVIAVDHPHLVGGSHGLLPRDDAHGPLVMTDDAGLASNLPTRLLDVHDWLLDALAP